MIINTDLHSGNHTTHWDFIKERSANLREMCGFVRKDAGGR